MRAVEVERAAAVATELAEWATTQMRSPRTGPVRAKAHPADIVTDTDERIETHVRAVLSDAFPRHRIEGEELGVLRGHDGAPGWVVDPVDGTTNFAHGLGWSSFSLGLADGDGPLLGVVADPWRGELFRAVRGQGATCNGIPIRVADHTGLQGHVLLTEWAAHQPWPGMLEVLAELSRRWCTVRVMGSTALSLVQVAAGRGTAALIGEFHPLDGLPAALIGSESGAWSLDVEGNRTLAPAAGGLLLSAPGAALEALQIWQDAMRMVGPPPDFR